MSGIVGFIDKNDKKREIIKEMTAAIAHRGPDSENFYVDENVALGHCLLKLKGSEKQPVKIDEFIVTFDGKINNVLELMSELNLKSNKESAILVEGYKKWGKDLPTKLKGCFSFIIWDTKKEILFGARDHFGIKPFYYYNEENLFMFASEIKALIKHPDFIKELNKDVISLYLIFNFNPSNETFFKGVNVLAPGTLFIYENNKMITEKYYNYEFEEEMADEETIKLIGDTIKNSVETLLKDEEDFGSFLSSGIDSSYLVSLSKPKKTYTAVYNELKYSEGAYAKDLAEKLGIENISKKITKEEYMSVIPKIMYHLDEPVADPATVALYFVTEAASKDVRIVLSGEGSDEFFGGYNIYQDSYKFRLYNIIPFFIRRIISEIVSLLPDFKGSEFLIRRGQKVEEWYSGLNWIFREKEVAKYLKIKPKYSVKSITNNIYNEYKEKDDLIKMQAVDINLSLIKNYLVNGDKMAGIFGIDIRTPFTDLKVFDIARKLPKDAKVSKNETKIFLREAAKEVIPNDSYKKKKLGFPVPLRDWIMSDDVYDEIRSTFELPIVDEIFNKKSILKLLNNHKNNKKDNYKQIWTIYCFIVWYYQFFE